MIYLHLIYMKCGIKEKTYFTVEDWGATNKPESEKGRTGIL